MSLPRRGRKYLIAMVGLPARGKSFTARKLTGYLGWLGYPTRSFNVGERRRDLLGPGQSHEFFDPKNRDAFERREALTDETLEEAFAWLRSGGRIAVFDATNGPRERRSRIQAQCTQQDVELLFVELWNDDESEIEENLRETKLTSPDYEGTAEADALADFRARIAHYASVYERCGDADGSWIRIEGRGRTVVIHNVHGWITGRIVSFLTNMQVTKRPIWLTRHGQSQFNIEDRIGGDSPLSPAGLRYAQSLASHARTNRDQLAELDVWTSPLLRSVQTGAPVGRELGIETGVWRALTEIDAGDFDGLTYTEVREKYPAEYDARRADKLRYRYSGGESYEDVIQRVDRVIVELERYRTPVLVITHRAVLRALYAYFRQLPVHETPHVDVPLHTIIELTPTAYGCEEARTSLPPPVEE